MNFGRLILIFCYFAGTLYYQYSSDHLNVELRFYECCHSCFMGNINHLFSRIISRNRLYYFFTLTSRKAFFTKSEHIEI